MSNDDLTKSVERVGMGTYPTLAFKLKKDTLFKYFKISLRVQIMGIILLYFLDDRSYVYLQITQIIPLFAAYESLKYDLKLVAREIIIIECIMSIFFTLILFFNGFGCIYLILYMVLFLSIPLCWYFSFRLLLWEL